MTCDMMRGYEPPSGMTPTEARDSQLMVQRVAELEQALCGLCQMMERPAWDKLMPMHPELQTWWDKHRVQPGCPEFEKLKKP
jgi:hypothetical protein